MQICMNMHICIDIDFAINVFYTQNIIICKIILLFKYYLTIKGAWLKASAHAQLKVLTTHYQMSLKVSHDPLDHKSLSHTHTYTEGGGNQSIRRKPPTVCPVNGCHREMHGRMKIRTKDTQFLLSLSHLSPSISHTCYYES